MRARPKQPSAKRRRGQLPVPAATQNGTQQYEHMDQPDSGQPVQAAAEQIPPPPWQLGLPQQMPQVPGCWANTPASPIKQQQSSMLWGYQPFSFPWPGQHIQYRQQSAGTTSSRLPATVSQASCESVQSRATGLTPHIGGESPILSDS